MGRITSEKPNRVAVIGGGAAGLAAALAAARGGACVTVFERNDRLGKKLLSTGNGRCNLTAQALDTGRYRTHGGSVQPYLERFGTKDTVRLFEEIGIPVIFRDGLGYPRCREASAVRYALEQAVRESGVRVLTGTVIRSIRRDGTAFQIGDERFERLILTCGGSAAPSSGSDGNGFALAESFGHRIIDPLPALVPLCSSEPGCRQLAGIRAEGRADLLIGGKAAASERGEIQFTEYGLSGIPVFQFSGRAAEALARGEACEARVVLCEDLSEEELIRELSRRLRELPERETGNWLAGFLPHKLIPFVLKRAGVPLHRPLSSLKTAAATRTAAILRDLRFPLTAARGFEAAQTTTGGVALSGIDEDLASRLIPGLFFAGEILDVDGPCGGYNLQWAWTSGTLAGRAAARE